MQAAASTRDRDLVGAAPPARDPAPAQVTPTTKIQVDGEGALADAGIPIFAGAIGRPCR